MNDDNDATKGGFSSKNLLPVPAVLATLMVLFLGTDYVANGGTETNGYADLLILPVIAAFAAFIGRIVVDQSSKRNSIIILSSLFAILFSFIAPEFTPIIPMEAFTFAFVFVSTVFLYKHNWNEESSILLSMIIGFHLAISFATRYSLDKSSWAGSPDELVDLIRGSIASVFFAFWIASITLGILVTLAIRGRQTNPGLGPWFRDIPSMMPKAGLITAGIIFLINMIPLIWLSTIDDVDSYNNHHYLGSVWALFASIVVLFVSFCNSERWHVLGTVVALNWLMYTLAHLHEIGNELPLSALEGDNNVSLFTWFLLVFWLNVGAMMVAGRGVFGDIAPRREHSDFRKWWSQHSYGIMVGSALVIGLAVRTGWNVLPAMNASGTGLWDMSGGSDPWYMKRVVDYVVYQKSHLIIDADRAYPMVAINPRPPLFSWSLALGGLFLHWLSGMSLETSVWWSVASLPAIFGALIVLPIAGLARKLHSNMAGIFAAWLIALMPGHIGHSTFGLADHDAFAMLFLAIAFYYWVKAMDELKNERLFQTPSLSPLYIIAGIRQMWATNPVVMSNATLSGVSFAIVALGWKGFVYGPGILFIAFAFQVFFNMFRRRDSLPITAASLQMMLTAFVIPLPFYCWPELGLLFDPSGFQPMFYIIGFTLALGWVSSSYRDKPWLLVLGSTAVLMGSILAVLYVLQQANIYDGWDVLFTGGFYFSKNKIFGTIGEAQAPSRGVLFASYGPIVSLIAIFVAVMLLWRGARKEKQSHILLGLWVLIAIYMAWSAGRFIFNATPAISVVGGIGIAMMWNYANFSGFLKEWRKSGISTPRSRFWANWTASRRHPGVPALMIVLMLVCSQHMTYGIDSGIPRGEQSASDVDQTIHDITPDIFRQEVLGFSLLNSENYDSNGDLWYMGTFGPGFNSGSWNLAYEWLSEQDTEVSFSERPAFVSWWDYGFQALAQGEHPTVADNFQSGIPNSGAMLLSASEEDTVSLFITTLAQGDRRSNAPSGFTDDFRNLLLDGHMDDSQLSEFDKIMSLAMGDSKIVLDRSMSVVAVDGEHELLRGFHLESNGLPSESEVWVILEDGEIIVDGLSNEESAIDSFNDARNSVSELDRYENGANKGELIIQYYDISGYRYTPDLIEDFDDVSTGLHRVNAKLALSRALLLEIFNSEEINDLYHDMSTKLVYEVQDYEGDFGEIISRNNEIRYFAVDNRLYPLGGQYYEDYGYHQGQTTGIFHAPTSLSGLDTETYISSVYQTQRGDGPIIPRSGEEYENEYLNDVIRQQSGALTDVNEMIRMVDIDYQHQPEFFDTMVARIYVGYGSSSLGLPGEAEQPAPHFYTSGAPGSYLENAYPLPGAMMNHLVLSNWYTPDCETDENGTQLDSECENLGIGSANTQVKVMKYYSGATIEGTVELEGIGPVPNARLLIERDAFSGDEVEIDGQVTDRDQRTYWIPIGTADADSNGDFSFLAPSGKIRVSAFYGESNLEAARTQIMTSNVGQSLGDIFETETTGVRALNPITGILGNVSGSTWLSETIVNISGDDGHSNGESIIPVSISVSPASSIGRLVWSGSELFSGNSLEDATIELSPSWDVIVTSPYLMSTSNGSIMGEDLRFDGTGEVTFTGEGDVITSSIATISDFTGNYTQTVFNNYSITGEGEFAGKGIIDGTINDDIENVVDCDVNETMPENNSLCVQSDGKYLLDGIVNASGLFTADGVASFTQKLVQSTLIGSGVFSTDTSDKNLSSYGTINATGSFSGTGIFSGVMVQPGTFHVVDAIPGSYDVAVIFSDDTRIEIDDGFTISQTLSGSPTEIDINGGLITGILIDESGNYLDSQVLLESADVSSNEADIGDCEVVKYAPCYIHPELTYENDLLTGSKIEFGPIMPGTYIASIDTDGDNFSETSLEFTVDPNAESSIILPSPMPLTTDLIFQLINPDNGTDNLVEGLDLTFNLKNGSGSPVDSKYDNLSGQYYVELTPGVWILNYTLSETEQLWEEIEVLANSDFTDTYSFYTSQTVNGTLYYDENTKSDTIDTTKILDFVPVEFYWDDFSTTIETSSDGTFSIVLPVGSEVDAIAQLGVDLKLVNGTKFTVEENMDMVTMVARPGQAIDGAVSVNRENNLFNSEIGGWDPVTVIAQSDEHDVTWRSETDDGGFFTMVLPRGAWEFTVLSDEITSGSNVTNVDNNNNTIEVIIYPEDSILTVDFFLDNSADNNVSNGTPVTYDFSLLSLVNGIDYHIDSSSSNWTDEGVAQVSVEPGIYRISVDIADPNSGDLFGTRIMSGDVDVIVGIQSTDIARSIGFDPEWRVEMSFINESGGELSEQLVRFTNVENGWVLSRTTDTNGSIIDFFPQGDWIATAETINNGIKEGLRNLISVSSDISSESLIFSTSQLAEISFNISEDSSNSPLSGVSLLLESASDLGSFSIEATNSSGLTTIDVVEGDWLVSLNYTEDGKRWVVESYPVTISVGENHIDLTANLYVALTGTVFWDLNNNNASNVGEGISDVQMTFTTTSDSNEHSISTDNTGEWELFVPYNTSWQIETVYDGFESINESISVSDTPNDVQLELVAGLVDVYGNISYALGISSIPIEDVELMIMPTEGLVRDTVTIEINEGWSGSWSTELEPGLWIVSASVPSQDLIIMGLLDVDVTGSSNNLDMALTSGGILGLQTEWLDYDGNTRNLGDISDANLLVDVGFGMKWVQSVDETGSVDLLLPNGNVQFSGDFEVEQRGLTMEFTAGRGFDVYPGLNASIDLSFNRVSNHEIEISTLNETSGHETYVGSLGDVSLIDNEDNGFIPVDFTLGIDYMGHESYDVFAVGGIVSGTDSSEWTVEFHNGTGNWTTSTQFEVGLDNSMNFDNLNIRVTPPNQSVAHSFEDGHKITVSISTPDGYLATHDLIVRVPQIHGFELTNPMADVYGVSPGELITIPIEFTNSGNGDEKYEFEFDDSELPDGWSRTGPTSHTLGSFVSSSHSVTVVSPSDAMSNEEFSIYVSVTDKAGNSYDNTVPIEIKIQSSEPVLKIDGLVSKSGGEPEAGGQLTYVATISNSGLVDAENVQLNAELCKDVSCNTPTSVNAMTTMDIPAESSQQFSFLFDFSDIDVDQYYIMLEINSTGFNEENIDDDSWHVSDGVEQGVKNVDVRSPSVDDDENTDIIAYILIIGLVIIGLYLTKGRSGRRPGAPF
ncbi:MAG: hypothetical protein CMA53_01535 [Euryarchaeota archaeon]|nr:hypothetical protein [Euryarchaeota archaeon]